MSQPQIKWQRPIEKIYGQPDRITFVPLAEGESMPPSALLTPILQGSGLVFTGTSLNLPSGVTADHLIYLAYVHPTTGEEFTARVTQQGSSVTVTPLGEPIPAEAQAVLPHRLLGLVSFNSGGRATNFASSAPLNLEGWETVVPTVRTNEATAEVEFYALGADYLTLEFCAREHRCIWLVEKTGTPKRNYLGELRMARYYVSGPAKQTSADVPRVTWTFRRTGPEFHILPKYIGS